MAGNDKKKVGKEKTAKKAKTAKSDWNDEKAKTAAVNVLDAAAMENAHNICHNVQDLLFYRGFFWEGKDKKGKGKGRKKKGGKK